MLEFHVSVLIQPLDDTFKALALMNTVPASPVLSVDELIFPLLLTFTVPVADIPIVPALPKLPDSARATMPARFVPT